MGGKIEVSIYFTSGTFSFMLSVISLFLCFFFTRKRFYFILKKSKTEKKGKKLRSKKKVKQENFFAWKIFQSIIDKSTTKRK